MGLAIGVGIGVGYGGSQGRPGTFMEFTQGFPPYVVFSRASDGTFFDGSANNQTASSDVARFDSDPVTGAPRGFLSEQASTNYFLNSSFSGVTSGTLADPITTGTQLGTSNVFMETSRGLSVDYSVVTIQNIQCLRMRLYGTATSTGALQLRSASANPVGFTIGSVFTVSSYFRYNTALSVTVPTNANLIAIESSGAFPGTTTSVGVVGTFRRHMATRTATIGNPIQVRWTYGVSSGVAYDFTVEIGLPGIEVKGFATSGILTSGTALTKAFDYARITNLAAIGFDGTKGTFIVEAEAPNGGSSFSRAIEVGLDSSNYFALQRNGTDYRATVVTGGSIVFNPTIGGWANGTKVKLGFVYDNGAVLACMNAGAVSSASVSFPTGLTTMGIGCNIAGGSQLDGWTPRVSYYPGQAFTAAQLQAATS